MKKRIISLALAMVMIFSLLCTTAFAAPASEGGFGKVESFTMSKVAEFSVIEGAWDNTTKISDCVVLYAPDNTINGYILHFNTGGVDSGFMQLGILNQELYVVNLGFDGNDILTQMVYHHNLFLNNRLTSQADSDIAPVVSLNDSSKVYYTGGFNYYLCSSTGKLVSLSKSKVVEEGITSLATEYSAYLAGRSVAMQEIAVELAEVENNRSSSSVETYTVDSYYDCYTYMKGTDYWPNYNDHCSPTAATNMVMYWKYGRGFFENHAQSSNQTSVFNWFYREMGTNGNQVGTDWDDIRPAYADYFASYSGAFLASAIRVTAVTFNKIRTKIDEDLPLHLEIYDYITGSEESNHSVNVWGYAVTNSVPYLRITNNWGTTVSNFLISYSDYEYGQYVYVDIVD